MPKYTHTLLATLGGQPQVVTFTLDLLLLHFPISEVIVVHPAATDARLQHSLHCLNAQFRGGVYHGNGQEYRCHFLPCVLHYNNDPLDDITDNVSVAGTLDTIHYLIRDLKQLNHHIHLSVTGGRRLMSLLAVSGALLHFRQHIDHIWHIHTPPEIQQQANGGALMHVSPTERIQLIEIPYVPWGQYFPNLLVPSEANAQTVLHAQIAEMDAEQQRHCQDVVALATPRQRDVLYSFARGLSPQEVAAELGISIRTVDTHKTRLLELCHEFWNIDEATHLGYHFLYKMFARFPPTDM